MGIEVTVAGVDELRNGIWETKLSPREVRSLGPCSSAVGDVTVLLLKASAFDKPMQALRFSPDAATVLNVGATDRAVVIAGTNVAQNDISRRTSVSVASAIQLGVGDRQFISALGELPDDTRKAGEAILLQVRQHFPGDLRAVSPRRFQETPDNFWFITVQPRDESLSITVRGLPNRFNVHRLKLIEDRKPYSRFKVKGMSDTAEATEVILHAVRKTV